MRAGIFVVLALGFIACEPPVDYGNPCRLTEPSGDGGVIYIAANDSSIDPRFDFLSNGDPDCEDLVCIRQAGKDYSALDDVAVDGANFAHGECSTPCTDATDCGDQSRGLQCTQLAFDQAFLQALCTNDPTTCNEYFGGSPTALFCTDPNLPDLSGTSTGTDGGS